MADITWEVRNADAIDNYIYADTNGTETSLEGVVTNVYLKCTVSNGGESRSLSNYIVRLDRPNIDTFTALSSVSKEILLQWALDKIPSKSKSLAELSLTNMLGGANSTRSVL